MDLSVKINEREAMRQRHGDYLEKGMNAVLADFIADIIRIKGAGEYEVYVRHERNISSDYARFHIAAFPKEGNAVLDVPFPRWEQMPLHLNWCTVDADGNMTYHEQKPGFDLAQGMWISFGQTADGPAVPIPVGIDWRTLIFERPTHLIARLTEEEEQARLERVAEMDSQGFLARLRKLLP